MLIRTKNSFNLSVVCVVYVIFTQYTNLIMFLVINDYKMRVNKASNEFQIFPVKWQNFYVIRDLAKGFQFCD